MTPDNMEKSLLRALICPDCERGLSRRQLRDSGITHCSCGARYVLALTHEDVPVKVVDEIPLDEHMGG